MTLHSVQHKKEAYWFYRFLSIFYDDYVNPFFWTEKMRARSLQLAKLTRADLLTIDVGSGTGFTTQGIVQHIDPAQVTCIDQSPHQMARARQKEDLMGCTFNLGDAENLPYPTDHFDRYVSAGSIEYWPDPGRGIAEAFRVIKPGGIALVIGPLRPKNKYARAIADIWMLFPEEDEYRRWFREAGFTDLQSRYIAPHWIKREKYGIAISGTKPRPGAPNTKPGATGAEAQTAPMTLSRLGICVSRVLIGSLAGFLFIPIAVFGHLRHHLISRVLLKSK